MKTRKLKNAGILLHSHSKQSCDVSSPTYHSIIEVFLSHPRLARPWKTKPAMTTMMSVIHTWFQWTTQMTSTAFYQLEKLVWQAVCHHRRRIFSTPQPAIADTTRDCPHAHHWHLTKNCGRAVQVMHRPVLNLVVTPTLALLIRTVLRMWQSAARGRRWKGKIPWAPEYLWQYRSKCMKIWSKFWNV